MDPAEVQSANPHRHPWELSRLASILGMIGRENVPPRVADVGAGDLFFVTHLARHIGGPVYAVDKRFSEPQEMEGLRLRQTLEEVPEASLDWATLMDVLEHVPDDLALLRQAVVRLRPGGCVLITVPAHPSLFSAHDVFLRHLRRYSRQDLRHLIGGAGLEIQELFSFYTPLFVIRWASKMFGRIFHRTPVALGIGHWKYPSAHPFTRVVKSILDMDFWLNRKLASAGWPTLGLSLCALCKKPSA